MDEMDVQTSDSQSLTKPAKAIADLTDEVKSLKATVKTLQKELDFVLSFLGITNIANSNLRQSTNVEQSARQTSHATATPSHTDGLVLTDLSTLSSSNATSLPKKCSDAFVKNDQPQAYANIVSKPSAVSVPFRHAVVSAVYADFKEKDRRAENLVISGLSLSSTPDKVTVEKLCNTEFKFNPQIVKCRRLRLPRPGRVQPVLVVLESVAHAEFLVKNAKLLHHSEDPVVRNSVFINADLTKAEALTAYQRRCCRRELAAARRSADNRSADNSSVSQTIPVLNTSVASADQSTTQSASVRVLPLLQSPVDEQSANNLYRSR